MKSRFLRDLNSIDSTTNLFKNFFFLQSPKSRPEASKQQSNFSRFFSSFFRFQIAIVTIESFVWFLIDWTIMATSINISSCFENPQVINTLSTPSSAVNAVSFLFQSALISAFQRKNLDAFRFGLESLHADPNAIDPRIDLTIFEKVLQTPDSSDYIILCIDNGADLYLVRTFFEVFVVWDFLCSFVQFTEHFRTKSSRNVSMPFI